MRFVRINDIFHIQLKQGKLYPNGAIKPSTPKWMAVKDPMKKLEISVTQNKFFLNDIIFPSAYAVVGKVLIISSSAVF